MGGFRQQTSCALRLAIAGLFCSASTTALAQTDDAPPPSQDMPADPGALDPAAPTPSPTAQQGQATGLEEIVVTARRVSESLQETPE